MDIHVGHLIAAIALSVIAAGAGVWHLWVKELHKARDEMEAWKARVEVQLANLSRHTHD